MLHDRGDVPAEGLEGLVEGGAIKGGGATKHVGHVGDKTQSVCIVDLEAPAKAEVEAAVQCRRSSCQAAGFTYGHVASQSLNMADM